MTIIRIKRSAVTGNPGTLANGEFAYSGLTDNGSNGGDRLYLGFGSETGGNAANHYIVGGKYYTDLMAGTAGTLNTGAKSVPILNATGGIDQWLVGNLRLTGDTISTVDTNGNLILSPNGSGLVSIAGSYTLPRIDGTNGYVLTTNGAGSVTWQPSAASLGLKGNGVSTGTVNLLTQQLSILGGTNVATTASLQTVTITVSTASNTIAGVASFAAANFTVAGNGAVSITPASIANAQFVNSSVTINGTSIALGATVNIANTTTLNIGTGLLGSSYNGSTATTISIDNTVATTSTAQVLTNKTIAAGSNSISGLTNANLSGTAAISNANLANQNITLNGVLINLGSTATITAANSQTLTIGTGLLGVSYNGQAPVTIAIDNTVATTSTAQVITNKTITAGSNTISGLTNANLSGAAAISNANLANSTVTIGTTQIALGGSSTTLNGLTQVNISNLQVTGNTISATNSNGSINFVSSGTGTIDVGGSRVTSLSSPTQATDAANKAYVDATVTGLNVKGSVVVATTSNLAANYSNGTAGVGATLTASAAVTLPNIDSYNGLTTGDRILVKDQTVSSQNGIYTVTSLGSPWVLTRATDYDNHLTGEVMAGDFLFVEQGTLFGATGWVQSSVGSGANRATILGTDLITFTQFAAAGSYLPGAGLLLNGTTFSATGSNGITVGSTIQLASSVAGSGLNYASGVLSIGGTTNRILVNATTVDISPNYVGQGSITNVGTVSIGKWTATTIAPAYGGTGVTSYAAYDLLYGAVSGPLGKLAMGTAGQVLQVNVGGTALTYGDIDGGTY